MQGQDFMGLEGGHGICASLQVGKCHEIARGVSGIHISGINFEDGAHLPGRELGNGLVGGFNPQEAIAGDRLEIGNGIL